jgi:beta-glucanase (GH16 family)
VQTNYFGKGITGAYDRSSVEAAANSETEYRTYTIEWTADQVVWQIDGQTVRVLTAATAEPNQYPQTPMQVKFGIWSGGDPSNSAGTVAWAGGSTNYAAGPFSMYIRSLSVADFSTGSSYSYSGTSGAWSSIQAAGGKVNPSGSAAAPSSKPSSSSAAKPAASGASNPGRLPTTGAGSSLLPWQTDGSKATSSYSNYPGLPSGWTVSNTGKAVPPSAAAGRKFLRR